MIIGILVYSYTGNTLMVAEKIKKQILKNGDSAQIHKVTCINGDPNGRQTLVLKDVPDLSGYNKLIIGAPINGFSLCKAMKIYFQMNKIKASQVNCFVTQYFKSAHFGGNRGIKQISEHIVKQGVKVNNTAIIHWSSKDRDKQIENAAQLLSQFEEKS